MVIITGTNGDDTWDTQVLVTTSESDSVSALDGNDVIRGSAGGNDTLNGGAGYDEVNYIEANLTAGLIVNNTSVARDGVAAFTVAKPGGMTDTLVQMEHFQTTAFDDTIYLGTNGYLFARGGDDLIYAFAPEGTWSDIHPGSGNDTIIGDGICRVDLSYNEPDEYDQNGQTAPNSGIIAIYTTGRDGIIVNDGFGGTDIFFEVRDINGSPLADYLVGSQEGVALYGWDGHDTLIGNAANDTLGGGAGNDVYYIHASSELLIEETGQGRDAVFASASYGLAANFETLTLTGSQAINGYGNSAANTLTGNRAANALNGLEGNDTLDGREGNDTLDGGSGADTMIGGAGDDTYVVSGADIITEAAGGGTDTVQSAATYVLGSTLENLTLTGSAAVNGTGNALANVLIGNAAANTLSGGNGKDTLNGGAGTDKLYGGADSAQDVFVFNTAAECGKGTTKDMVYDFTSGTDRIDLRGIDANTAVAGDQAFKFNGATAAANAIWCVASGGVLVVSGDVNGDKIADFQIGVSQVSSLLAGDFLL